MRILRKPDYVRIRRLLKILESILKIIAATGLQRVQLDYGRD